MTDMIEIMREAGKKAGVAQANDFLLLDESGRPIADENGRLITIERDEQLRFLTEKM